MGGSCADPATGAETSGDSSGEDHQATSSALLGGVGHPCSGGGFAADSPSTKPYTGRCRGLARVGPRYWIAASAFGLPLAIMLISDVALGLLAGDLSVTFHHTMPVVYLAFAINVCLGMLLRHRRTVPRLVGVTLKLGGMRSFSSSPLILPSGP